MPSVAVRTSTPLSVLLSSPSELPPLQGVNVRQPSSKTSWIQVARTGSFKSNRYGKFAITKTDLSEMLKNFTEVAGAGRLPVDWDHLSMDPKRPGDGAAAGWFQKLELRADGQELWGEVEWCPIAALQISTRQYRYVSPSFQKNHVDKTGDQIGTTLLAAALTNHPFLTMAPVTLSNGRAAVPIAILEETSTMTQTISLAERGQRVRFSENPDDTPELTPEERAQTLLVQSTVGDGDDQFAKLIHEDGTAFGWYRVTCLRPADASDRADNPPAGLTQPDVTPQAQAKKTIAEENAADAATLSVIPTVDAPNVTITRKRLSADRASDQLLSLATAYASEHKTTLAMAVKEIAALHPALVEARDLREEDETPATPDAVVSLSAAQREATSFSALVTSLASERKLNTREAMALAAQARPDLAASYSAGAE